MKIGKEVEGSFQGATTVFIGVDELDALLNLVDESSLAFITKEDETRLGILRAKRIEAIYISDLSNTLDYEDSRLMQLSTKFEVTLEVTEVKPNKPSCINLMYHIQDPKIWQALSLMAGTDQIKFSEGLNVLAVAKRHLVETKPEAFQNDIEI